MLESTTAMNALTGSTGGESVVGLSWVVPVVGSLLANKDTYVCV